MTLDKPVAGVSTLDALAEQAAGTTQAVIVPWMDAQRGDVFATAIDARSMQVLDPPVAEPPAVVLARYRSQLAERTALFIGDAAGRDASSIASAGEGRWSIQRPDPLAPHIARIAIRMARAGQVGPPHALVPTYVRRPDAEIDRDKRDKEIGDASERR